MKIVNVSLQVLFLPSIFKPFGNTVRLSRQAQCACSYNGRKMVTLKLLDSQKQMKALIDVFVGRFDMYLYLVCAEIFGEMFGKSDNLRSVQLSVRY